MSRNRTVSHPSFRALWTASFFAFLASCTTTPPAARGPRNVVLSVDSLQPAFYLDPSLDSPVLRQLAAQGASASAVEVIYPSITYPVHTTLVTGVSSEKHGITSNRVFTWESGPTADWYWESTRLKVPALWDLASQAGKKVALLGWPVTVGARADWVVPEVFPPHSFDPREVWDRTVKATHPELLARLPPGPFKGTLDRDQWMGRSAAVLLDSHAPDLMLLHFSHVDVVQHLQGPGTEPFRRALADVDRLIGEVVSHLDFSRDCLMIVGDHGFSPVARKLRINALFKKKGWLDEVPPRSANWKAVAFTSGAQAAVYIKDRSIETQVLQLLRAHAKGNYRILDRASLDHMQALPGAWIGIEPEIGVAIAQDANGPFEQKLNHPHGEHGYLPDQPSMETGFIATGRCAQPGKQLGRMSVYDVAATIAAQAGVTLSSDLGKPASLR